MTSVKTVCRNIFGPRKVELNEQFSVICYWDHGRLRPIVSEICAVWLGRGDKSGVTCSILVGYLGKRLFDRSRRRYDNVKVDLN
jgi:hypothetical protein